MGLMIFWLSFCDPERPKGTQFLGASLVEADDLEQAIRTAHRVGANPGGEVMSMEVPQRTWGGCRPHLNRLMQREELEKIFGPAVDLDEMSELVESVPINVDTGGPIQGICQHVNARDRPN